MKPAEEPKKDPPKKQKGQKKEPRKELSWKQLAAICSLALAFIALPVFLSSSAMMRTYQRMIDRNPESEFSKWLQMASADLCFRTFRPELAADYYRRFRDNYKNDIRRPKASLRYAMSLEEAHRNADAVAEYQRYAEEYPDREDKQEAVSGIDRIRYVKPE